VSDLPFATMAFWLRLLWIARTIWACRVSVLSAIAGFWLFWKVPQAQDLFADISYGALPGSRRGWLHWTLFFVWVFLVWAFPVHYAARSLVSSNAFMIPWRLRNRTGLEHRDLCIKQITQWVEKTFSLEILLIPRILGLMPFLAVAAGLWNADSIVKRTIAFDPSASAHRQILTLYLYDFVALLLFITFIIKRKGLANAIVGMAHKYVKRMAAVDNDTMLKRLAIISILASTLLYLGAYICPFLPAATAPRAVAVPFLFGSLVLFASLLVWLGARSGFPVLETAVLVAVLATSQNGRLNDMRILATRSAEPAARQIDIEAAIEKWKVANHCEASRCPPTLIVAAEGGASRAAFAAATALGYLFDKSNELPDASSDQHASPARRVFAISGVSGGAFGAVAIRTALWEAQNRQHNAPPCVAAPRGWFAPPDLVVTQSWRGCLQALVAGDYLTPAFVGLAFRDNLAPRAFIWGGPSVVRDDRAALVERAWEYHFDRVTRADAAPLAPIVDDLKFDTGEQDSGLRRLFGYVPSEADGSWLPLLLLNGTSVNSGARIIASDLVSTVRARGGKSRDPLYPAAYDLFEMLSKQCPNEEVHGASCETASHLGDDVPARRDGADVRLSTTAMLSARFPIVSPAATRRRQRWRPRR
jgi:hypothetical protein